MLNSAKIFKQIILLFLLTVIFYRYRWIKTTVTFIKTTSVVIVPNIVTLKTQ